MLRLYTFARPRACYVSYMEYVKCWMEPGAEDTLDVGGRNLQLESDRYYTINHLRKRRTPHFNPKAYFGLGLLIVNQVDESVTNWLEATICPLHMCN